MPQGTSSICVSSSLLSWLSWCSNVLQDELEAELEDLEGAELEEQLLQPSTTQLPAPTYSRPTAVPAKKPPQNVEEDDELAALQAEMAL